MTMPKPAKLLVHADLDDLRAMFDEMREKFVEVQAAIASLATSNNAVESPIAATVLDKRFRLRTGTTKKAIKAGVLAGCSRIGRGGIPQCWVLPSAATAWFASGCPTRPKPSPL